MLGGIHSLSTHPPRTAHGEGQQVIAGRGSLGFDAPVQRTGGWIKRWLQDLIGAGLAVAVGLGALTVRPFSDWVESWSYDLPYRLRPQIPAEGIVLVTIDPASMTALGQESIANWNRQLHASLVDRLMARGARTVGFIAPFSEPSSTNSADRAFAQALRRSRGRVVLAGGWTNGAPVPPIPELASAAPWGVLAGADAGGTILRRLPALEIYPTFASRMVQGLGNPSAGVMQSRWMNYYAPSLALPEVSYERALRGTEPPGFFKGRIVLVSASTNSIGLPTPYTRWTGQRMTQAELEATTILNLSRREWLSRLPASVESGAVIIAGLFLGLAFMGMRRRAAVLLACGAGLLVAAGNFVLCDQLQLWFPWLAIAAVQIPVAFSWAWLCDELERPRVPRPGNSKSATSTVSDAPMTSSAEPQSPATDVVTIPDHQLLRCIGRGAYGEVWLVRDVIGRHHAVKIVKARSFPDGAPYEREFKGIERFAAVSRNHPGLVQVLHVGRNDALGCFYYIMELADDDSGSTPFSPEQYSPRTLASVISRHGHLSAKDSVQIGLALCAALQHLHERQLVHRDIKPSNIIFVEGRVKIADIGLVAEINTTGDAMTRLGTDGYLAPEGPGTPQADLYSLGKVLYEISMGRDRRQFPEFPTTLGARPDQEELRRLHEIIMTACEDDPALRYPSAAAMHDALANLGAS